MKKQKAFNDSREELVLIRISPIISSLCQQMDPQTFDTVPRNDAAAFVATRLVEALKEHEQVDVCILATSPLGGGLIVRKKA